jgi:hypothetical protein
MFTNAADSGVFPIRHVFATDRVGILYYVMPFSSRSRSVDSDAFDLQLKVERLGTLHRVRYLPKERSSHDASRVPGHSGRLDFHHVAHFFYFIVVCKPQPHHSDNLCHAGASCSSRLYHLVVYDALHFISFKFVPHILEHAISHSQTPNRQTPRRLYWTGLR